MSIKFTSNIDTISAINDNNIPLAIRFMLDGVEKAAFPRTPKNKGNLRKDILKVVKGKTGTITWDKDYAVYQEDKQYAHYTTPGTGPHYAEKSVQDVINDGESYLRKANVIE